MNAKQLNDYISGLTSDILFSYNGVESCVLVLSKDKFVVGYGDDDVVCKTPDEAMKVKMFDGQSLNEIADKIDLL
jgi:hypothetical protein